MPHPTLPHAFDVLIVGGGAAGLYTALCLPKALRIGLITKDSLSVSASDWAQGGIAAAIAPEDSPHLHVEDTLKAGAGLCNPAAVQLLVEKAPECVRSLVEMGVAFDRQGEDLALTLEAAHSRRRVLHAADATGRAMVSTLAAQVLSRENIQVLSQAFVLNLWIDHQTCRGVCLLHQDQLCWLQAKAIVLASGGGGQVFAQTTNPSISTGDGVAMAWRAGAELRDLEFVQFHPTALTYPGAPRFLISEAVRGEGAHLVDDQGHRFTFDYHPAGELAPRDIVSRAIFSHLKQKGGGSAHVWLDLKPIPEDIIRHRFPNIIQVCQRWGIDVFKQSIPVAPAAHYWMGGIVTDTQSRTSIAGLYTVGESASTGVHGANRLASNSLLECLVFGAQFAHLKLPENPIANLDETSSLPPFNLSLTPPTQPWRSWLARLMWQSAGICRDQQTLEEAIAQVKIWREEFAALSEPAIAYIDHPTGRATSQIPQGSLRLSAAQASDLRTWSETRNLLDLSDLILKSALFRTESRGGHYRSDYPHTDNLNWQVHTLVVGNAWKKSSV
ncbi:MAG: L-aspartate oxidase [Leptolyngbyaceae cyanobacterium CSU_1_4]|nr:L-aspartate oxidase [Leptolyngbyaceae cyanobacterium CSU_1_4]